MLNLFSYRATDPAAMLKHEDPAGDPENLAAIVSVSRRAGLVIACWGNDGKHMDRGTAVRAALDGVELRCLKLNMTGEPKHPLYHKKAVALEDLVTV